MAIDEKRIDDIIDGILFPDISFPENSIGELLKKLNIQYSIDSELPHNISGVIFIENNIPKIAVNKADHIRRRVFSLAHELGHYKLNHIKDCDRDGIKYRLDQYSYDSSNPQETKEETEANYFAASLLVPKDRLIWALSQTNDLEKISDYFGVSNPVIKNRMKWLGL